MSNNINQLPVVSLAELKTNDLLAIFSSTNGDTRKASITTLISLFKQEFTRPDYETTVHTPGDGFSITVTQDGLTRWELLRPTGALATGTLVLPAPAVATDGQEILVTTTLQISAFTVDGNGATAVYGAPSVLAAEDKFKLRYNLATTSWYCVG